MGRIEIKFIDHLVKEFGIGRNISERVCCLFGIHRNACISEVGVKSLVQVMRYLKKNYILNDELRNNLREGVLKEYSLKSYKSNRRSLKLPLNGQRSKTNSKTVKKLL